MTTLVIVFKENSYLARDSILEIQIQGFNR